MVGFMSGFGSAFSDSFNKVQDRKAQQEDDLFKMQYQSYLTKADKLAAKDKENSKRVKQAKDLAQFYDQPAESWTQIYSWLENDIDVEKELQNGMKLNIQKNDVTAGDTSGPDDGSQDLSPAAESSVNAQMTASGMQPAGTPSSEGIFSSTAAGGTQPPQQNKGLLSGIFGGGQEDPNSRLAEATMQTPEDVKKVMEANAELGSDPLPSNPDYKVSWTKGGGGKPDFSKINNINDAIAYNDWAMANGSPEEQASGKRLMNAYQNEETRKLRTNAALKGELHTDSRAAIIGPDGKPTGELARPSREIDPSTGEPLWQDGTGKLVPKEQLSIYDATQEKEIKEALKPIEKEVTEYNAEAKNFNQIARTGVELKKLASKYGYSLGGSGKIAETVASIKNTVEGAASIVTGDDLRGMFGESGNQISLDQANTIVGKLEEQAQALGSGALMGRVDEAALGAILIENQVTRMALMQAAALGQTGNAVSARDFERFYKSASGGGKKEGIIQNAQSVIRDSYKSLKDKEQFINTHSKDIKAFENRYQKPFPEQPVSTVDELIGNDEEIKGFVDESLKDRIGLDVMPEKKELPQVPDAVLKNFPQIDAATWDSMNPEERKLFTGE